MGDRVRAIRDSDPLGLYQAFLDKVEETYGYYDLPFSEHTWNQHYIYHRDYDGVNACYRASKMLETQNPTLSTALLDNAVIMTESLYDNYPGFNYGPLDEPTGGAGYNIYNLGFRCLSTDPSTDPVVADKAARITANYARGFAFAKNHSAYSAYYTIHGDGTYPSSTTARDPAVNHFQDREWALAVMGHIVADSGFSTHEQRSLYTGYDWVDAHDLWIPAMVGRYFLGSLEQSGSLHQWRAIQADLEAVDGDWSQVPETWTDGVTGSTAFASFYFYHISRPMIYFYEDGTFNYDLDNEDLQTLILQAVTDMCDWMIMYWQKATPDGYNALIYRIRPDPPYEPEFSAPNNALMAMPMFAWAWSKTGDVRYWNMAADLIEAAIYDGYWVYGWHVNEKLLWAADGFKWLGWGPDTFNVFWR